MQQRRYPGVSPFTSDQKNIFFGRDEDISKLLKYISLRNQLLLYSKSGVGKTSILNAGVLPELKDKYTIIKIRFNAYDDNGSPVQKLVSILKNQFKNELAQTTILDSILQDNQEISLWYHFKKIQLVRSLDKKFLLVFDQFEELFSYPDEQIYQFKTELQELLNDSLPNLVKEYIEELEDHANGNQEEEIDALYEELKTKSLFVIRADRLNLLNKLVDKLPSIQKNFYELKPLTLEQSREAIIKPAMNDGKFGSQKFKFSDDAISKILNTLSNNINNNIETTQLQIVCQRVEENVFSNTTNSENIIVEATDLPPFKDIFYSFYERSVNQAIDCLRIENSFEKEKLIKNVGSILKDCW